MKNLILSNLGGKKIFVLFILTNMLYVIMILITIPKLMYLSQDLRLLDMMPMGYNHEYVSKLLASLGVQGRKVYLFNQIPVDLIYPLFFGVSYCLLLAYILNKLGKSASYLFYLCLLPVIAGFFDYLENFGIITMLNAYPANPEFLTSVTNVFTILKSFFTTIYFFVLIITLIVLGLRYKAKINL